MTNIANAPGFWDLIKYLAHIAWETNEDTWHEFTISLRTDGDNTIWVGDASLSRRLLPVTGPTISTGIS